MASVSILDAERLSLSQAARKLDLHVSTLHRWRLHGFNGRKLRCLKLGGRTYVTVAELERFVTALSDPPAEDETADDVAERANAADKRLTALGL